MKNYTRESRPWLIWLTIIAVISAGVGIYFYYSLFRQSKSELIEAIPTDAVFILALNDNEAFVSGTSTLVPYLNDLLVMDALPAFETLHSKLPAGEYDLTISGHTEDDGISLLLNMHADKAAFKRLLRALSIDPNNYVAFENNRIYTYGTNYKSLKFVYGNHIISCSPDMDLLKRAVVQSTHPKNLLSNKQFKEIYNLSEKNRKQNWLIINPEKYMPYFATLLQKDYAQKIAAGLKDFGWTAFQLRFSANDIYMSGYMITENPDNKRFDILENVTGDGIELVTSYPSQCNSFTHLETPQKSGFNHLKRGTAEESEILNQLSPSEIGYFSLKVDTMDYHYAIMLADSSHNILESVFGSKADSIRAAHPDGLYPISCNPASLLPFFSPDTVGCFIVKGNVLVFAPSAEAIKSYQKSLKNDGSLSQNRYYGFLNDAVSTTSVYHFAIINSEDSSYWPSKLSEKGKASVFGKNMRIFSLSCESKDKGKKLVPINLYLHF